MEDIGGGVVETPEVSGKLVKSPENVISTYQQAHQAYTLMQSEMDTRYPGYEKVRKLKVGNPPVDPKKLEEAGLGYMSNTNWREYASDASKILASWKEMVAGRTLIDTTLTRYNYKDNLVLQDKFSQVVSQAIRKWDKWKLYHKVAFSRAVDYGFSVFFFPDPESPDFLPISPENFYYPTEAKLDFDYLPYCGISHKYSAQYLMDAYKSDVDVWRKDALGQLLFNASIYSDSKVADQTGIRNFGDLAASLNNKTISYEQTFNGPIRVVTILSKEYDGKVSKSIYSPDFTTNELIYFNDRPYEDYHAAIVILTYKDDIEYLAEAKGYGQDSYNTYHQFNHLNNSIVNTVRLGSTKFIESPGGEAGNLKRLKVAPGGLNILPVGYKPTDFKWDMNIASYVEGVGFLKQTSLGASPHLEATKIPHSRTKNQIANREPDRVAAVKTQKTELEGVLEKLDIFFHILVGKIFKSKNHFLHKEIKRIWERAGYPEDVILFTGKKLDAAGVPLDMEIQASRVVLYDQEQINELFASGQIFDSRAFRRVLKMFVGVKTDRYMADYLLPDEEDPGQPTREYTEASVAANQLSKGEQVTWSIDLDHEAYIDVILERLEQILKGYQEHPNPIEILAETDLSLSTLIPFVSNSVQFLARDKSKKDKNEYYNQRFYMVMGMANGIHANAVKNQQALAKKQAELEAAKQGLPTDPKVMDVMVRGEIDKMKERRKMISDSNNTNIKFAAKMAEVNNKAILDREEMLLDNGISAEKERQTQARENAKAAKEIANDNQKQKRGNPK